MTRVLLFALLLVPITPRVASSQDESQFHRIDAKTPEGLRELFRYEGASQPLLSARRGVAAPGYPENYIETFEHTYDPAKIPAAKASFFYLPNDSQCSRMEMVRVADSGKEFSLDRSGEHFPWGIVQTLRSRETIERDTIPCIIVGQE